MTAYRMYLVHRDGGFVGVEQLSADGDVAAKLLAAEAVQGTRHGVELWEGARLVARQAAVEPPAK
jgi:hypothetical protein